MQRIIVFPFKIKLSGVRILLFQENHLMCGIESGYRGGHPNVDWYLPIGTELSDITKQIKVWILL